MSQTRHPMAPEHLPAFVPGPDGSDPLFTATAIGMVALLLLVGTLYLRLHALPERMAHRVNHVQLQAIAVLALLALFTHNHVFWLVALLLAVVELPDVSRPLVSIARSLRKLAGEEEPATPAPAPPPSPAASPPPAPGASRDGEG